MLTFLYTIHILLCLALMLIVLIQAGKGSGVGLSIGGGMSQTMFGGSGGKPFFMKVTAVVAALFMVTCLVLAYLATKNAGSYHGVVSDVPNAPAPAPVQPSAIPTLPPVSPSK